MSADFDLEAAITRWRTELAAHGSLRGDDLEELESHLRDEMDGLAEVGIHGEEAFAHASRKLGTSGDLAEEFARGNPSFAWRTPALLVSAGVLFHFLDRALPVYAEHVGLFATTAVHASATVARVAAVVSRVVPSLVAVGLVLFLAPALLTPPAGRVESRGVVGAAIRIALVSALALIVPIAMYFPFGLGMLDLAQVRSMLAWHEAAAPASRLVWRVTPFLLAVSLIVARRRALRGDASARAVFWVLAGALCAGAIGRVWNTSLYVSVWAAQWLNVPAHRLPIAVGLAIPVGLAVAAYLARPATPQSWIASRAVDVVALGLACTSLVVSYWYAVFFTGPSNADFLQIGHDATSPLRVSLDVILPALLGAAILRLRSRLAETRLAD